MYIFSWKHIAVTTVKRRRSDHALITVPGQGGNLALELQHQKHRRQCAGGEARRTDQGVQRGGIVTHGVEEAAIFVILAPVEGTRLAPSDRWAGLRALEPGTQFG